MILLDSNIVIYLFQPATRDRIAERLRGQALATCNLVKAEVLGYPGLTERDAAEFRAFLDALPSFPFDDAVTEAVIEIRRRRRMQLPDAVIAGTALVNELVLWTHDARGFQDVPGLRTFDPLNA